MLDVSDQDSPEGATYSPFVILVAASLRGLVSSVVTRRAVRTQKRRAESEN